MLVLEVTEIPMSVPAPVIVLLSMVRSAASNTRIATDAEPVPAKPEPITVLPANVPPAPPTPYWTLLVAIPPGRCWSGGPIVLAPPTLSVTWPDPVTPFF